MMQYDRISWSIAIVSSLFLHSLIFVNTGARMGVDARQTLQMQTMTRLSFNQVSEENVSEEPYPIEEKKIVPVKEIKPEPATEKIEHIEHDPVVEPVQQMASQPQPKGEMVTHSTDSLFELDRQQYLYELMSHIESFKYYPRSARKRGIEGAVRISFTLRNDGSYDDLMLHGENTILVKAARGMMNSSVPLPLPSGEGDPPEKIEFSIRYSLSD